MKQKPYQGILTHWYMSTFDCRVCGTLSVSFNNRPEGKPICTSRVILIERRCDGVTVVETENSKYILM